MNRVQRLQPSFQESSHEAGAWNLSTEIESDITTLAAICQVRHQQRAPLRTNVDGDVNSAESAGDEQMHVDRQPATSIADSLDGGGYEVGEDAVS